MGLRHGDVELEGGKFLQCFLAGADEALMLGVDFQQDIVELFVGHGVVDIRRERDVDFVPDEIRARRLAEKRHRLEEDIVGEADDAPGGGEPCVRPFHLHHVEAQHADGGDAAGHARDGHAVAGADVGTAEELEVGDHREDHVLHREGDTGGDQPGERGQRTQVGEEGEEEDKGEK